jgi:hypothetical protein
MHAERVGEFPPGDQYRGNTCPIACSQPARWVIG